MSEVLIIDIYNQGVREIICLIKKLPNQIKIAKIIVNHHRQMALKRKLKV